MKDNITFGAMAGAIGGAVGLIFSYSIFLLGISPISSINLAATLVVTDVLNLTMGGVIWSIATHLAVASLFGILLIYIFVYTGKDYWLFKGIMVGVLFCIISHSFLIPLMRTEEQVRNLIFNVHSFGSMTITHSLIGLITAFIIVKYHHLNKTKS